MDTLKDLMVEFQILGTQPSVAIDAPLGVELDGVAGDEEAALQQQAMDALGAGTDWASLLKRQKALRTGGLTADPAATDLPPADGLDADPACGCDHNKDEVLPAAPEQSLEDEFKFVP